MGGRPNADSNTIVYMNHLQGYPNSLQMCSIADHGVHLSLHPSFKARRPWLTNLPIAQEAIPVAFNKITKEYNLGRRMIAHANVLGRNCINMAVPPMSAVKKGDEPLSKNVRVINALSPLKNNSINSSTLNQTPDACFGRVTEIADEVLKLRREYPFDVRIMAFKQLKGGSWVQHR